MQNMNRSDDAFACVAKFVYSNPLRDEYETHEGRRGHFVGRG